MWVIFVLLDPDPDSEYGSTNLIQSGSGTLQQKAYEYLGGGDEHGSVPVCLHVSNGLLMVGDELQLLVRLQVPLHQVAVVVT